MKNKKTILLVDDEESILFSLQRILELSGNYEIVSARNGKEALLKIKKTPPDLIISDIHMPEMDGLELCKQIREKEITRTIPFIFLTAVKESMVEGFKIGADDFIKKPFSLDEVLAKIEAIFRRVDMSREQASQFKGSLSEYPLEKILNLCHKENISGNLVMQQNEKLGRIELAAGDIKKVSFLDFAEDKALDILLHWEEGIFVLQTTDSGIRSTFVKEMQENRVGLRLNEPVEIADQTWWVGTHNPDSLLQTNVFLRRFRSDNKAINYLVDPGSPEDLEKISARISKLTGTLSRVHIYSLSQPDPDVCMNAIYVSQANPKAVCLTSEENWQLINHYGLNAKSVKFIQSFKNGQVKLSTGQMLQFIPAPFCHHKGAFLTYDPQTRVLFSGDLFSGLGDAERLNEVYAEEQDWRGIRAFHQMYMPSNKALRHAVEHIRALKPAPLLIAPQHGLLWCGDVLERFLERIYHLHVGTDLLNMEYSAEEFDAYLQAGNEILHEAVSFIPINEIMKKIELHPFLLSLGEFHDGKLLKIYARAHEVYENLISALALGEETERKNRLKSLALKIAHARGLPAPHLDWDSEPTMTISPDHLFDEG